MEALTDDIVYSLSAFLRPHDLLHLALTSRRFGGSPGRAELAERAAKRRRCLDDNGAEKSDGRAGDEGGREGSLMDDVARGLVEGHHHFSSELLQRKGGESWMAVLHRLEWQQQLIEEAMAAAPAIFAKPGDKFRLWDRDSADIGEPRVRYEGRNEDGWPPSRGWLVFHNFAQDIEDILDNLDLVGPVGMYAHHTPSGDRIDQSLCLPPEHCGAFISLDDDDDDLMRIVEPDRKPIDPTSIKERVKGLCITSQMLTEAKEAAPALVAKPGDLFEWNQNPSKKVLVRYTGRNEVPPIPLGQIPLDARRLFGIPANVAQYSTPKAGWLAFHSQDQMHGVQSIRDCLSARSERRFSHYDTKGNIIKGTLCIPPERCGALNVHPKSL